MVRDKKGNLFYPFKQNRINLISSPKNAESPNIK